MLSERVGCVVLGTQTIGAMRADVGGLVGEACGNREVSCGHEPGYLFISRAGAQARQIKIRRPRELDALGKWQREPATRSTRPLCPTASIVPKRSGPDDEVAA